MNAKNTKILNQNVWKLAAVYPTFPSSYRKKMLRKIFRYFVQFCRKIQVQKIRFHPSTQYLIQHTKTLTHINVLTDTRWEIFFIDQFNDIVYIRKIVSGMLPENLKYERSIASLVFHPIAQDTTRRQDPSPARLSYTPRVSLMQFVYGNLSTRPLARQASVCVCVCVGERESERVFGKIIR